MAFTIFPSTSNISGGKALSEQNLRRTHLGDRNWAQYGLGLVPNVAVPADTLTVAAGEACMGGHQVWFDGSMAAYTGAGLGVSTTKFIHLKVTCDGSGNVAAVALTVETTCIWMAGSAPTVYWLCLGKVTVNAAGKITEVVNAIHFPPHGQGYAGRAQTTIGRTISNTAADTAYKVSDLYLGRFMAPRPCLMVSHGTVCVKPDATCHIYGGICDDATPQSAIARAVTWAAADYRYISCPIEFAIPIAAGACYTPRIVVEQSSGTRDLEIGTGHAAWFGMWLMDDSVGL